jgi:hypothetical protein
MRRSGFWKAKRPNHIPANKLNGKETMSKVSINQPAPDFALADFHGQEVRLSDYRGKQPVVLVFNRGFI